MVASYSTVAIAFHIPSGYLSMTGHTLLEAIRLTPRIKKKKNRKNKHSCRDMNLVPGSIVTTNRPLVLLL